MGNVLWREVKQYWWNTTAHLDLPIPSSLPLHFSLPLLLPRVSRTVNLSSSPSVSPSICICVSQPVSPLLSLCRLAGLQSSRLSARRSHLEIAPRGWQMLHSLPAPPTPTTPPQTKPSSVNLYSIAFTTAGCVTFQPAKEGWFAVIHLACFVFLKSQLTEKKNTSLSFSPALSRRYVHLKEMWVCCSVPGGIAPGMSGVSKHVSYWHLTCFIRNISMISLQHEVCRGQANAVFYVKMCICCVLFSINKLKLLWRL